jgi:uncharacterized protein (DUF1778 family)
MTSTAAISLRIPPSDRDLIDRASAAVGKSRTEFMLESARAAATDALIDRRMFVLNAKQFKSFEAALNKAPSVDQVIAKLEKRPSPWKR